MTGKFVRRTFRNAISPARPYFAHLAITQRCNLRCRFCPVTETRFDELDTDSTKRAIDALDRIGVAVMRALAMPGMARKVAVALAALLLLFLLPGAALRASDPGLPPAAALDRMEETGRWQRANLDRWTNIRVYSAANQRLNKAAKAKIHLDNDAAGRKTYRVLESSGSPLVLKLAIIPAVEAECQSAVPGVRATTDISRGNYEFHWIEFDEAANAYVFEAAPRAPGRYQFRGQIWIDAGSFGIARVKGSPAVSPSFWVKRTDFVHEYRRIGPFWLPAQHHSTAELRVFGTSTLDIEYDAYQWGSQSRAVVSDLVCFRLPLPGAGGR